MSHELPPLPPIKREPRHGYYPWWPEDGDGWVHPEDVAVARRMIPGPRIWRREGEQGDYVVIHYGPTSLRVKRTLWREVSFEGFDLGDFVEVRPRGLANEPHHGHVREMRWEEHEGIVRYQLELADGTPLEREYEAHDLKPAEPPAPREEFRREPPADLGEELTILEP